MLTLAVPLRTVHAKVPLSMLGEMGLLTPWEVITPSMLLQRTSEPPLAPKGPLPYCWAKDVEASNKRHNAIDSFFIDIFLSLSLDFKIRAGRFDQPVTVSRVRK